MRHNYPDDVIEGCSTFDYSLSPVEKPEKRLFILATKINFQIVSAIFAPFCLHVALWGEDQLRLDRMLPDLRPKFEKA